MIASRSTPKLVGAKRVLLRLTNPRHADLDRNIELVERGWDSARRILTRANGICGCGHRWKHLMDGVEVMLLDRSPYTARCWDDDRVWINLPKFSEEVDRAAVLVHEFMHRVWFQCLSREQQDRWLKSWKETKKRPSPRWATCSGTVSSYACTDDIEDFAEVGLAVVYGRVDAHNWKRWLDMCGCHRGTCERPTPRASIAGKVSAHADWRPKRASRRSSRRASRRNRSR